MNAFHVSMPDGTWRRFENHMVFESFVQTHIAKGCGAIWHSGCNVALFDGVKV